MRRIIAIQFTAASAVDAVVVVIAGSASTVTAAALFNGRAKKTYKILF